MRLMKNMVLSGTIKCETGLHIGGSQDQMEIGGVDLPIIKHPVNGEPYIPGSSLKGKMRSQLEKKHGRVTERGEPCMCGKEDCLVCRVFGAHKNVRHSLGATRILVRDALMSKATRDEYARLAKEKGLSYIEKKTENIINRNTGTAEHPRSQERIPSGAEFDLEIVIQLLDIDGDGKSVVNFVKEGLQLVQESYLGGYGSRGSGKVSFNNVKLDGTAVTL